MSRVRIFNLEKCIGYVEACVLTHAVFLFFFGFFGINLNDGQEKRYWTG